MKQIALTIIALLAASAAWAQDDVYFVPTKKALEAERQEMYGHSSYDQIAIPTDKESLLELVKKNIKKMPRPCRWQQQIPLPPKGRLNGIINIGIS